MHKLVGPQLFWSGTPTFCQMGVLNSCFQNPSESSDKTLLQLTLNLLSLQHIEISHHAILQIRAKSCQKNALYPGKTW